MSKSVQPYQDQAKAAADTGLSQSLTYGGNASGVFGNLEPQLTSLAAHPQGMSAADLAAADTAAQQSAGGSQSAATGQGALLAGRTRNAGSADAAIARSTRTTGEQLGEAGLTTRLKNASLKQQQQEEALKGLGGLYGSSANAGNQALSMVANADKTAADINWGWMRNVFSPTFQFGGGSAPSSP